MNLVTAARKLVEDVKPLEFGSPVAYVYNPLVYARVGYEQYVECFGKGRREVALLGMNPGPWGMAQTGVPFGVVTFVRDWMKIEAPIGKPEKEHPKRPVTGFDCPRLEVSGKRFWGWAKERFGPPENFFKRFFVLNYCPLAFLEESGRNRTPDKLGKEERAPLFEACDRHLRQAIDHLEPRFVIGIGKFAEKRAREALGGESGNYKISSILHPSPANPKAGSDWGRKIEKNLKLLGIRFP